ncbi:voltage-dependent chloride channel 1, chloroplastic-like [Physcomitrium patens]|uniref:Uncharacterized protein n=1 Tax=Physcomitrium patens TaxID=3218 RepID=A0A2K1KUH5_PHYPA|nr:hypothetical protein PHYPA_004431 [Physcomitrium patens]
MHRNKVYGHLEWARHKSSWRHGRHIFSIFSLGVIFTVFPPVLVCTLFATFSVLSLLLVLRTNSSYNRFDEARKFWGSNVNRTRDLVRQSLTWIRQPGDSFKLLSLLRHIKAYFFCLRTI